MALAPGLTLVMWHWVGLLFSLEKDAQAGFHTIKSLALGPFFHGGTTWSMSEVSAQGMRGGSTYPSVLSCSLSGFVPWVSIPHPFQIFPTWDISYHHMRDKNMMQLGWGTMKIHLHKLIFTAMIKETMSLYIQGALYWSILSIILLINYYLCVNVIH